MTFKHHLIKAQGQFVSTIKLFHTFNFNSPLPASPTYNNNGLISWMIPNQPQIQVYETTSLPKIPSRVQINQIYYPQQQNIQTQKPIVIKTSKASTTVSPPPQKGHFDEFNSQCGIPSYNVRTSTGLVVQGKAAAKGQVGDKFKLNN